MGTHRLIIEGKEYEVAVGPRSGNRVEVTVNGKAYRVDVEGSAGPPVAAVAAAAPPPTPVPAAPVRGPAAVPAVAGTAGDVPAPISGLVLKVAVTEGQQVNAGDVLVVLEAMKMENEIFAPAAGTVERVAVKPQQEVAQGDLLVTLKG